MINGSAMFAGHLGAALLLKRVDRGISLGGLFLSVMLLDVVLWVLVLAGAESVRVPSDLQSMADLTFDFPYSHGLVASLGWSLAVSGVGWFILAPKGCSRGAIVLGVGVFSHFALDWLVHIPEMPMAGRDSALLGLGLWKHLPLAWCVESALALGGLWIYLKARLLPRRRAFAVAGVMLGVTAMTILGQASKSSPPSPPVMATTSLVTIALLVWFGCWVERRRESPAQMGSDSRVAQARTHFCTTVEIPALPTVVWAVMADVERWPEWTASVSRVKLLNSGPLRVGSRARIHQPRLPPAYWRVTELNPGSDFTWVSVAPGVRVTARHLVEATTVGCRVTLSIRYEGAFGRLLARWIGSLNERYLAMEADGLKSRCTGNGGGPADSRVSR